jgi:hypothetical protein
VKIFIFFFLLSTIIAVSGANAATKSCSKGDLKQLKSLCYCKTHDLSQLPGDEAVECTLTIRSSEAANMTSGKACNEKICMYRVKLTGAHISDKGPWVYSGNGMVLTIKDKDGTSFRATLIDDRKRSFIFDRMCAEGPCDPYHFVSGPDKRALIIDGGAGEEIVKLSK